MKKKNLLQYLCGYVPVFVLTLVSSIHTHSLKAADVRVMAAFKKIEISGPYQVILIQGSKEEVSVDTEADLLSKIITKVESGTLKIYHQEKMKTSAKIIITITFKEIDELDCSGAIDLKANTPIKAGDFDLDLSGATKMELELACNKLDVDISGAGSATFSGKAKSVELDISGTGSFSASKMEADNYNIDISGAGSAKVNAISNLDVSISGTGSVSYTGNPKVKKEISGAGSVTKI